jgi:inositol transport system substrate-binding protein
MRNTIKVASLIAVVGLAFAVSVTAATGKKLTILSSMPGLSFPFFVHMMNQVKAEATKLANIDVVESDGQVSSPKQTADVEAAIARKVDGIIISPNEVDAMAPALQEAIDAKIPVVTIDRRVTQAKGVLAHVGADNVKGGEAQGQLIMKLFPNGASVMNLQGQSGASPAIDRNKGVHNVLDKAAGKYKFVFEQTAGFDRARGLSVTESALASLPKAPDVIVAANDDMALGAMEAVKARGLAGKVAIIGFDALPEAIGQVRDGGLTATIEQFPGAQSRKAVDIMVSYLRDNKQPESKLILLTPVAITKANLKEAERLGELK